MSQKTNQERLADAVTALGEAFGRPVTRVTHSAYWMGLEDLPIADVERACKKSMLECKFMPTVADIRERCGVMSQDARAALAFEALGRAILAHGSGNSVNFDDPVIHATIRNLGGWPRVCQLPLEEYEKWFRREFERVYIGLCRAGISPEQGAYLVGEYEAHNRTAGHLTIDNQLKLPNGNQIDWEPKHEATGLPEHSDPRLRIDAKKQSLNGRTALPRVELQRPPEGVKQSEP